MFDVDLDTTDTPIVSLSEDVIKKLAKIEKSPSNYTVGQF